MEDSGNLLHEHREDLESMFEEDGRVKLAYVFGSRARNEAGELSDMDLAVLLDDEIPEEEHADVLMDLYSDIPVNLPEADIAILNGASSLLAYNVIDDGVLLHEISTEKRVEFESEVLMTYLDRKHYLSRHVERGLERYAREGFA